MTPDEVISNSSPIIALAQIGLIDLLPALFPALVVPPAVRREIRSVPFPDWIVERHLTRPIDPRVAAATLDAGEREAISLALEGPSGRILLDDLAARLVAERLGLAVNGSLGVLLRAKERGLIPLIRPHLDALVLTEFFIGERLYRRLLAMAGES